MTFDLTTIAIFTGLALVYGAILPAQWRGWALCIGSALAVYWLQPILAIRHMDFILPTTAIVLTVAVWLFTRKTDDAETAQEDWMTLGALTVVIIGVALTRYLAEGLRITSRPPGIWRVVPALIIASAGLYGLWRMTRRLDQRRVLTGGILLIIVIFVVLKTESLAAAVAEWARARQGQDTSLANVNDIAWLGFSYLAFRWIHTLRDRQTGKLPALTLREYATYALFFPSYIAGPIDRAERFVTDFHALPQKRGLDSERIGEGLTRIAIGVFKKFVIADTLALGMALNATNAAQATDAIGLWILLYGYALRLFLDFSGYSDIAIGIGILLGVKLPENFNRPYFKSDLASFWQSWHITLSNWARFYVFTPVSRWLLTRKPKPSPALVVLSSQLTTMVVIGLWHGVTWNFLIWGAWHGVGLFIHKQWSDRTRKRYLALKDHPAQKQLWALAGWFVTFHFVVIGWVWFALPGIGQSADVLGKLFGM